MSDLISRSELLDAFNNKNIQITFDLPIEEVLGEDVDLDDFAMLVQDAVQAYKKMAIDTIKIQPTAYSIDKVVEDIMETYGCYDCEQADTMTCNECPVLEVLNDICEIVKQGGISDDVCEWRSVKLNYEWKPSCEPNSTYNVCGVAWFKRCPYCGKKIKVVE